MSTCAPFVGLPITATGTAAPTTASACALVNSSETEDQAVDVALPQIRENAELVGDVALGRVQDQAAAVARATCWIDADHRV